METNQARPDQQTDNQQIFVDVFILNIRANALEKKKYICISKARKSVSARKQKKRQYDTILS